MPKTVSVLILTVAILATAGFANSSGASAEPGFGPVVSDGPLPGAVPSFGVKLCHGSPSPAVAESLAQMLKDSSGGRFGVVDTYQVSSGGHAAFPATEWYDLGYRAILALTDLAPMDSVALGDSLAKFIQLGGGVAEVLFSDASIWSIRGGWRYWYAPFTVQPHTNTAGSMGTVYQPLHPIMASVSAIYVSCYRTGNTTSTLRSPNCVSLAEWADSGRCLAACFDSAGQRAASLGMCPLSYWDSTATGQWCRLTVNALEWAAVGPSVGVTAPNGGENWAGGTVHDITWTQTSNGVKDSIYYSTDAGSTWTGVAYFDPPPFPYQYAWTVPLTTTSQARVKVVTWNADGGRVEDASDANFTIATPGTAQSANNTLPPAFVLHQPFPNPLRSGAAVRYALPRAAQVELQFHDAAGALVRRLVDGAQAAGNQSAYWNGRDDRGRRVAPGVYYCRFKAGDFVATQKLVVRR
jgi:hypothetical protein